MRLVKAYGMLIPEEEYEERFGSVDRVVELSRKYGIEVVEGETALDFDFIRRVMDKMDSIIESKQR